MTFTADDARHMARALALAQRGLHTTDPNPRVGCVMVKEGHVVGEGFHARAGEPHAEVLALRAAAERARGATVYLTLEPCCHHGRTPPCTDALITSGVARVIAAMPDPNPRVAGQGFAALNAAGIKTANGLMQAEAEMLNPGFILRMKSGRPYVRLKIAASLDGCTASADGDSKWITGEHARADVQQWRARSSAIVTGIGTVLADDPSLNVRLGAEARQPLRVVLDSRLRMSPSARLLALPGATLIVTASNDAERAKRLVAAGAEILHLSRDGRVDLAALLAALAAREVNEVLVEAGATLAGAFLDAGLVDELVLYYAPDILGSAGRGMFVLPSRARLDQRSLLELKDVRAIGRDWRLVATLKAG